MKGFLLKTSLFVFLFVIIITNISFSQTLLINPATDGGFENGATLAANGWTGVTSIQSFFVGSPTPPSAGTNCAYSSTTSGSWTPGTSGSVAHIYKDVTIPVGETALTVTLKYKTLAVDAGWDYLKVHLVSTSTTPVGGTMLSTGQLGANTDGTTSYATYTFSGVVSTGLQRLVISFRQDGVSPYGAAAVDEISVTSTAPTPYTWIATSGSAAWNSATSWSPDRSTPMASDILNFSNGGTSTVTIPSGSVGGNLVFSNNTTANFQASAINTLTLSGLTIGNGSTLYLNGTTAQTLAFSSGSVNTIDGRLEIVNTSGTNIFNSTNTVTTVSSTGVLAGGTTVSTSPWTGASLTTLIINGTYEHKYTTTSGTIPTATWGSGSYCNVIGYTTNTNSPGGISQNFSNFTWNCPSQTGNLNLASSSTTGVSGTFSLISTGTGECRWTGTGGYTVNANNFEQSGGTFDLANGSSGSSMSFNVAGTFNQTAGVFRSSGTSTNNPTLHFNGSSAQVVNFNSQPTGPITYRFSNASGVTINGSFASTFTIGNGTLGGVRISTAAATPVSFGGTLTGFAYNQTGNNSTLTYDVTGNVTANSTVFPATDGPTRLTVNVGSGNVLTLPFSRTIPGTLAMTSGDIDISSYTFTLGTSGTTLGTLSYSAGNIRVTSGAFKRWFGTSGLPTSAGTGIGYFPISSGNNNRHISIYFSAATALSAAGTISASHSGVGGLTSVIPSFLDGAFTVDTRTNASWTFSTGDGITASGTIGIRLTCGGAFNTSTAANLRVIQATGASGTFVAGGGSSPNFQATRTAFSLTDLAQTHYIGAGSADMQLVFNSLASGDWNNPASWDANQVPVCTGIVTILNGHNITVNSAGNVSKNVAINVGGTLTIASGDLTVGCTLNNNTLTNNGTLTVSGGTLNLNGNMIHNTGSIFNQSAGSINVDGNANGNSTNSVASGVSIIQLNSIGINWTGGTLTIVDPHANTTASNVLTYSQSSANVDVTTGHTLRFGDGVSTEPGGNATNGFRINTWSSSSRISFNNIEVAGGIGTNRFVTSAYTYGINGNLNILTDGEFRMTVGTFVAGNITNNGTLTHTSTLTLGTYLNGTSGVSSNEQTISGSGLFRNSSSATTANLTSLTVNNNHANGVHISLPLSISGTLTLTAGIINTTATNILQLGTATVAGTLSGGSSTAYINGPFARTFAASRTAVGTFDATTLFPVGKSATSAYLPIHVDPTTNSGGSVIFSAQAFTSNSGSGGPGVTNLSSNRWEALITSGATNFTSMFTQLNDASIVSTNKILQAKSAAGIYGPIPPVTLFIAGTPNALRTTNTQLTAGAYYGFFAYGDLSDCIAPANQPTNFVASNLGSTGFTGSFTAATSSPSNYLVVRYADGVSPTSPVDFTTYAVGDALGTGVVRSISGSTSFVETGLSAGFSYDYYVYSYNNSACNGPVFNTISPLKGDVTTCATETGAPGTPTASNINSTSFLASWTASSTSGVNYIIDVATNNTFTTFVPGWQAFNLGSALSTSVTGLSASTTYYVRVRAEIGGCYSVNSGTLTVLTDCSPELAPTATETFTTYTGTAPPPVCWKEATGTLGASSNLTYGSSEWNSSTGFANTGTDKGVKVNLYSSGNDWIISQPIDLGAVPGLFRVSYKMAVTSYNGTTSQSTLGTHKVDVVVSTDGGASWSNANVIKTYTGVGTYSNTGQTETINLATYSGVVKIAFVETTTSSSPDIDFHIDDFKVEDVPPCPDPSNVVVGNLTNTSATASWDAGSPAPAGGYQYYYSTSSTAPNSGTTPSGSVGAGVTSVNITGLTSNTTYYFWVRSNCSVNQSNWIASGPFTTLNVSYIVYIDPSPKSINDELNIYFQDYDVVNNFYTDGQASIWMYGGVRVGGTNWQYPQGDINNNTTLVQFTQQSAGLYKVTIKLADYFCIPEGTVVEGVNMVMVNQWGPGGNNQTNDLLLDLTDEALDVNPPTGLASSNVLAESADISWDAPVQGADKGYEYAYSTTNSAPGSGTFTGTTDASLSGLSPQTTYYFWARTKGCGADVSAWSVEGTFETPCLPPTITGTTPASRCGTGTVTLGATASAGDIYWYANETGGAPLGGPGTSFTTPVISSTTTYWAGATGGSTNISVGLEDNNASYGTFGNPGSGGYGLYFTSTSSAAIASVYVYPQAAGSVTIQLQDGAGTLVPGQETTVSFLAGDINVKTLVTLNFNIPAAGSYRLMNTVGSLGRFNPYTGPAFPLTYGSTITITQGSLGTGTYYSFFDWVVAVGCVGTRTSVTATVSDPPALTISDNAETACSGIPTPTITITSNTADYDVYAWDPSVGVSGNSTNGYTFAATSNTQFILTASQSGGSMCQNTATFDLTVDPLPVVSINPGGPISIACGDVQQLTGSIASSAADHAFSATSGTFTPLVGGTAVDVIEDDDVHSGAIPLEFSFTYDGNSYTSVYANSNGWLSFNPNSGNASASQMRTNSAGAPADMLPLIAPLWDDLDAFDAAGAASYKTEGTTPNRVFTMEWLDWEWYWGADEAVISFQVKLYETSNKIELIYQQESGIVNSGGASIGIMSSGTNYLMLNGTGTSPIASSSTFTTSLSTKPATGQVYAFEPPVASDYEWDGPSGTIFTNAGATTPYTGQNLATVYVKPIASGTNEYSVDITNDNGCVNTASRDIEVGSCDVTLNLTAYIEGYMDGSVMRPVLLNSGEPGANSSQADHITVSLHNASAPHAKAYEFEGILGVNGTLACTFPGAVSGNSYYVVLTHRNALETWSASPVLFSNLNNYSFASGAGQAYGGNLVQVSGVWCMYSGDINYDGFVWLEDYSIWETSYNNFDFGYFISDFNGDGSVWLEDYTIWEANYNNFIGVIKP